MFRQPLVFLLVPFEVLLGTFLHGCNDVHILIVAAFKHEELLTVPDDLRVNGGAGRVTERQEIDGIQHIGLANTVLTNQTVDFWRQFQGGCSDVLVIDDRQFLENHSAKVRIFFVFLLFFTFLL